MISYISTNITIFLIRSNALNPEDEAVCIYGCARIISSVISFMLLLIAALLTRHVWEGALFMLCFSPLRRLTGGYHANSYVKCKTIFIVAFLLCIGAEFILLQLGGICKIICLILLIWSIVTIARWAPVESPNKLLEPCDFPKFKRLAVLAAILQGLIGVFLMIIESHYYVIVSLVTAVVAFAIVIEILKRRSKVQ